MTVNKGMIAEILSLSSQLNELVETGGLTLEFPTSETGNSDLGTMRENPRAVDYIVRSEES